MNMYTTPFTCNYANSPWFCRQGSKPKTCQIHHLG